MQFDNIGSIHQHTEDAGQEAKDLGDIVDDASLQATINTFYRFLAW